MTALLGLAPVRSARASAANHRDTISACQHDDLVLANRNGKLKATDTSVRGIPAPRKGAPAESRNYRVSSFAMGTLSASS
jgi:hypothetical protein